MALQTEFRTQGDYLFKHRSYLPLIFLVVGWAVYVYGEYYEIEGEEEFWILDNFEYICLFVSLLGLAIRVHTVGHSPKNTSGRNTGQGQIADQLNTTGMYSLVRHPLYVGNFLMWLGVAMLTENLWFTIAFIFLYWIYYERIMYAEEQFLIEKFGDLYVNWSRTTPAFVPNFKHYHKPALGFSIKKAVKKEKNGLAAIFLLFWFFEWSADAIEEKSFHLELDFWLYAAVASGILYLILKVLKKKGVFNEQGR